MNGKRFRVSADIGGTFTDLVFYDTKTGEYLEGKTLTTPKNLSDAVLNGIGERITNLDDIEFFVHGTTSGLNAFLERKGVKVALLVTKGFRDVYEIARGNRPRMYDLRFKKPTPLISRLDVFEIDERMLSAGQTLSPVDKESVIAAAKNVLKGDYTSVAVCLINAYNNPAHEIEVEKILSEHLPGYSVSLSHRSAREWREYERTSTTVINAYIAPIVQRYLDVLEQRMVDGGFDRHVHVMQSGGGVITAEIAKNAPIQTLMSGPVGGAVGIQSLSSLLGYPNLIGVDMGGTSYDVSLVLDGKPDISAEVNLEGFPILIPMVNIYTIGAGGGSIAWVEAGGLRVGPESAGAMPGPACYGNGGTKPTLTDANVALGRLVPEGFLGGGMKLDKEASVAALETIAAEIGMTVTATAEGICEIADAKMADAIRQLTVRKGIDPRDFVLVAFGGAGPLQACSTADELEITRVLVPEMPGIFSAWGMMQSDIRQDLSRTLQCNLSDAKASDIAAKYSEMMDEALILLNKQHIGKDKSEFVRSADLRYLGQEYTVRVTFESETIDDNAIAQLTEGFHQTHHRIYGHSNPQGDVEVVNLRLVGLGKLDKIEKKAYTAHSDKAPVPVMSHSAMFSSGEYETKIYNRKDLICGQRLQGPAIILELTATTVVPPSWELYKDNFGNLMITKMN